MIGLITGVHVVIALVLILIVLLQSAKGTDVGSAFGGMGSQAAFGPRGTATFLSKATVGLAIALMLTSIGLSIMSRESFAGADSVLSGEEAAPEETAETPPEPPTPPPSGGITVPVQGMPGVEATITVEDPDEAPDPNAPAESGESDAAPESPPSEPAPTP